jgi:hypothetical protein
MSGGRIIAGYKRLHTKALVKIKRKKEEYGKSYLSEYYI